LDTKLRKVFDENNKELHLTGNAFRVLVFLCDNKSATVTEIGDFLDREKDYDENHIRQYRYKINTIIGKDAVQYKNNVYSIVDDVKKVENLETSDRNTDLLHPYDIKLTHMNKSSKVIIISFLVIAIIIAGSLFLLIKKNNSSRNNATLVENNSFSQKEKCNIYYEKELKNLKEEALIEEKGFGSISIIPQESFYSPRYNSCLFAYIQFNVREGTSGQLINYYIKDTITGKEILWEMGAPDVKNSYTNNEFELEIERLKN